MHHFEYHKKGATSRVQMESKYPWLYLQSLSEESIIARFFLLEYLYREFGYSGEISTHNRRPAPLMVGNKLLYWSISHSENYIAFTAGDNEVAIDIDEICPRSTELLKIHSDIEYHLLGKGKTWEAFFILWAAKEIVIKLENITLDDISNIRLKGKMNNTTINMIYESLIYEITIIKKEGVIIAYAGSPNREKTLRFDK